jgi:hypothetical protein
MKPNKKPAGFRGYKDGKCVKNENTEFYAQGVLAKSEGERVDLYAKPGTSAAQRQGDSLSVSYPTSRYRSRRP